MNRQKRERLQKAIAYLNSASAIVDAVCDQETDCMDNMPENLQESDRYEKMEAAVDNLNDALESIGKAVDSIESAIR